MQLQQRLGSLSTQQQQRAEQQQRRQQQAAAAAAACGAAAAAAAAKAAACGAAAVACGAAAGSGSSGQQQQQQRAEQQQRRQQQQQLRHAEQLRQLAEQKLRQQQRRAEQQQRRAEQQKRAEEKKKRAEEKKKRAEQQRQQQRQQQQEEKQRAEQQRQQTDSTASSSTCSARAKRRQLHPPASDSGSGGGHQTSISKHEVSKTISALASADQQMWFDTVVSLQKLRNKYGKSGMFSRKTRCHSSLLLACPVDVRPEMFAAMMESELSDQNDCEDCGVMKRQFGIPEAGKRWGRLRWCVPRVARTRDAADANLRAERLRMAAQVCQLCAATSRGSTE